VTSEIVTRASFSAIQPSSPTAAATTRKPPQ
jgi:hypothetical protein